MKTASGQRSFPFRGAKASNSSDKDLKGETSLGSLKKKLSKFQARRGIRHQALTSFSFNRFASIVQNYYFDEVKLNRVVFCLKSETCHGIF